MHMHMHMVMHMHMHMDMHKNAVYSEQTKKTRTYSLSGRFDRHETEAKGA